MLLTKLMSNVKILLSLGSVKVHYICTVQQKTHVFRKSTVVKCSEYETTCLQTYQIPYGACQNMICSPATIIVPTLLTIETPPKMYRSGTLRPSAHQPNIGLGRTIAQMKALGMRIKRHCELVQTNLCVKRYWQS